MNAPNSLYSRLLSHGRGDELKALMDIEGSEVWSLRRAEKYGTPLSVKKCKNSVEAVRACRAIVERHGSDTQAAAAEIAGDPALSQSGFGKAVIESLETGNWTVCDPVTVAFNSDPKVQAYWKTCPTCGIAFTGSACPACPPKPVDPAMGTGGFLANPPFGAKP